ncbi:hypothetical protein HYX16_01085 [Candidatus Woesearchaeota archaeon]|nr:hypothetical protein [Candidatus Woesearchaeota archaeon]
MSFDKELGPLVLKAFMEEIERHKDELQREGVEDVRRFLKEAGDREHFPLFNDYEELFLKIGVVRQINENPRLYELTDLGRSYQEMVLEEERLKNI